MKYPFHLSRVRTMHVEMFGHLKSHSLTLELTEVRTHYPLSIDQAVLTSLLE